MPKVEGEEHHDFGPRHQTQTRSQTHYPHTPLNPLLLRLISQPENPDQVLPGDTQPRSTVRTPNYPLNHSTAHTNPLSLGASEVVAATGDVKMDMEIDPTPVLSDLPPPMSKKGWKCPRKGCKYYSRISENLLSHWHVSCYSS